MAAPVHVPGQGVRRTSRHPVSKKLMENCKMRFLVVSMQLGFAMLEVSWLKMVVAANVQQMGPISPVSSHFLQFILTCVSPP